MGRIYVIAPENFEHELGEALVKAIVPESAKKEAYFGDFIEEMINKHRKTFFEWFDSWQEDKLDNAGYRDELIGLTLSDEEYIEQIKREAG